jgi:Cu/Ag efflux protein CusF
MRPIAKWPLRLSAVELVLILAGCGAKPEEKHYLIQAKVVAVDSQRKLLIIDHGDIPGFMPAMTMSYTMATPSEAAGLHPGDKITADLVVTANTRAHLEKIRLLEKTNPNPAAAPAPGS